MPLRRIALIVLCLLVPAAHASAAPRGLDVGFLDYTFSASNDSERITWLDEARSSGASTVRVHLDWAATVPSAPANAADPADTAYNWRFTDAAVQAATARGLRVVISMHDSPRWAEGPDRPRRARAGSWKPSPVALRDFVQAAARRYPGVRYWQIWNEPNLDIYLGPQWIRSKGRTVPFAPQHYRRMLNGAYAALKRVNPANVVVGAGTAPYGDPPGNSRTRPVVFWKNVFRRRTSFDIFAHHPYSVGGPRQHALSSKDVSVPDLGRLTRIVRSAVRRGKAVPRKRKRLWITEISWDSNPPDPNGVPSGRHASWLSDAFYVLWKQGADTVLWFQVRDQDPAAGLDVTNQSGIYTRSGQPKLAQQAFAFPVACELTKRGKLRVWGKAPVPGPVELVRGTRSVGRLTAGPRRVFLTTISGRTGVQAKAGNQTSLKCVP